jgi:hypothetical protein
MGNGVSVLSLGTTTCLTLGGGGRPEWGTGDRTVGRMRSGPT